MSRHTADMLTNSFLMCEHFPRENNNKNNNGQKFSSRQQRSSLRYSTQSIALKKFDVLRPAYQNISKRAIEKLMSQSSRQFLQFSFFCQEKIQYSFKQEKNMENGNCTSRKSALRLYHIGTSKQPSM